MSMILEDLEFVEVDLNNTTFDPLTPIPESPAVTPKRDGGGDEHEINKTDNERPVVKLDIHLPSLDTKTSESSLYSAEKKDLSPKQRVVDALQRFGRALGTQFACLHKKKEVLDDTSSFDGHLFEYAMHVPTEPRVNVPRLQLKPTRRERAVGLMRRVFLGCVRNKQTYSQTSE